jgi:hypothetical protein
MGSSGLVGGGLMLLRAKTFRAAVVSALVVLAGSVVLWQAAADTDPPLASGSGSAATSSAPRPIADAAPAAGSTRAADPTPPATPTRAADPTPTRAPADLTEPPDPDVAGAEQAQKRQQEEAAATDPGPLDIDVPPEQELGGRSESVQDASEVVTVLVEAQNEILQRADGGVEGLELIADGWVKGELEAMALERSHAGLTQVGEARVVSVEATDVDLRADPPVLVLEVCLDTSDIDVLDASGQSVGDLLYRPGHPVRHLYGAEFVDGRWKVTTHDIPTSSSCSVDP